MSYTVATRVVGPTLSANLLKLADVLQMPGAMLNEVSNTITMSAGGRTRSACFSMAAQLPSGTTTTSGVLTPASCAGGVGGCEPASGVSTAESLTVSGGWPGSG